MITSQGPFASTSRTTVDPAAISNVVSPENGPISLNRNSSAPSGVTGEDDEIAVSLVVGGHGQYVRRRRELRRHGRLRAAECQRVRGRVRPVRVRFLVRLPCRPPCRAIVRWLLGFRLGIAGLTFRLAGGAPRGAVIGRFLGLRRGGLLLILLGLPGVPGGLRGPAGAGRPVVDGHILCRRVDFVQGHDHRRGARDAARVDEERADPAGFSGEIGLDRVVLLVAVERRFAGDRDGVAALQEGDDLCVRRGVEPQPDVFAAHDGRDRERLEHELLRGRGQRWDDREQAEDRGDTDNRTDSRHGFILAERHAKGFGPPVWPVSRHITIGAHELCRCRDSQAAPQGTVAVHTPPDEWRAPRRALPASD